MKKQVLFASALIAGAIMINSCGTKSETIKGIDIGDEIAYDYSTTVGIDVPMEEWSMDCLCNSSNCRKKISNILTINKEQLEYYVREKVIPDYQKNSII